MDAVTIVSLAVAAVALFLLLRTWRKNHASRHRIAALAVRLEEPESMAAVEKARSLERALSQLERAVNTAALRETNRTTEARRLVEALQLLSEGVVVADDAGHIVYANKAARRWLGGRHVDAVVDNRIRTLMRRALTELACVHDEIELLGPPRCTLELAVHPLDDGERSVGVVCFVLDRTEARRVDAVRRDFVSNISHELKTPVSALGLLAETLNDVLDEPALARRLGERLTREATRLVRIIDDLLALSRLEAEEAPERDRVSVDLIVAEAAERIRAFDLTSEIKMDVFVEPNLVLVGDRRQLTSAVYNLLENAVKYSAPTMAVLVRVRRIGAEVEIIVEDSGIGIAPAEIDRIFERFYRVDRARSRATGGTGLGLAIARHAITNHGGRIDVTSVLGEGSSFKVTLPLADTNDEANAVDIELRGYEALALGELPESLDQLEREPLA